ncbi:MAG: cytochrome c [Gammaproteobacteria bacterium]
MNIFISKPLSSLLFLAAASASSISFADDKRITDPVTHGKEAHTNHCYKCHSDDIYTRENRFVKSIDALSKQVVRCKNGSDIPWFDEDADAVVQFLNKKYYRF